MDNFFKEAVSTIKTSGTITPSSKFLIRNCLKDIDFNTVNTIVEFGSGDGCVTAEILARKKSTTNFYSFELNEKFFNHCTERFGEVDGFHLVHGSAYEFDQILERDGIKHVDYFICSLPLTFLDKSDVDGMIDKVQQYMKPNGMFIQYLYSLSRYRFFKRRFDKVALKMTLLNVPPAIVYRCTNNEQ